MTRCMRARMPSLYQLQATTGSAWSVRRRRLLCVGSLLGVGCLLLGLRSGRLGRRRRLLSAQLRGEDLVELLYRSEQLGLDRLGEILGLPDSFYQVGPLRAQVLVEAPLPRADLVHRDVVQVS